MILSLLQDSQCQISCTKSIGDFVVIRNTYEILNTMEKFHLFVLQISLSTGKYKSIFWDIHEEKKYVPYSDKCSNCNRYTHKVSITVIVVVNLALRNQPTTESQGKTFHMCSTQPQPFCITSVTQ
jgi:hypothetical protein